jgi:hypothetical protein
LLTVLFKAFSLDPQPVAGRVKCTWHSSRHIHPFTKETLTEIPGFEHVNLFMPPETGSAPWVTLATRFPL